MYNRPDRPYDATDPDSIYQYAKRLVNRTLREMATGYMELRDSPAREVKGKFGQYLEKHYFGIENNSDREPDFKEAGLELKTTPIRRLKNKKLSPKERLVLSIIDFDKVASETWEESSFLKKNEHLLLIIYLYEDDKDFLDFLIRFVEKWKLEGKDKEIIRQDWEKIIGKIREGKAHELSEGDTFYLGACRKGHREKPRGYSYGDVPAKQRAFSFKTRFMSHILQGIQDTESAVKETSQLKSKSFEEIIHERFHPFLGLDVNEIEKRLGTNLNTSAKGYYAALARRIMGVERSKVEEFEKADVKMKIIRMKHNGVPKEDMSFPYFKYKDVASQEWEDSGFCGQLETKFFFVVYQMDKKEERKILKKAFFWNMPHTDMKEAKRVWETTRERIREGVKIWKEGGREFNNLPNKTENLVAHVRPHGRDKQDTEQLPDGREITKSCFWLNAQYLKEVVENH